MLQRRVKIRAEQFPILCIFSQQHRRAVPALEESLVYIIYRSKMLTHSLPEQLFFSQTWKLLLLCRSTLWPKSFSGWTLAKYEKKAELINHSHSPIINRIINTLHKGHTFTSILQWKRAQSDDFGYASTWNSNDQTKGSQNVGPLRIQACTTSQNKPEPNICWEKKWRIWKTERGQLSTIKHKTWAEIRKGQNWKTDK